MAYFNHAFRKTFFAGAVETGGGVATTALTQGAIPEVGFFDSSDWLSQAAGTEGNANDLLYIVQGSYHTQDTIGNNPGHGGYTETIKSKGINYKYVTKIWRQCCQDISRAETSICVVGNCAPCGDLLYLRMDVKGSPALRFLNHNAYALGDSSGDAKANGGPLPGICCADGQEYLDPAMALAAAAQMLLADPLIHPFARECQSGATLYGITVTDTTGGLDGIDTVTINTAGTGYAVGDYVSITGGGGTGGVAEVTTVGGGGAITGVSVKAAGSGYAVTVAAATGVLTGSGDGAATIDITIDANTGTFSITDILNGGYTPTLDPVADGVTACACFEGAYVETKFGDCSFDTRDHYNKEPVQLVVSVLDETGNPCNECGTTTNVPGEMATTSGETIIREAFMTEDYMQSPYNQGNKDSARMREIELSDDLFAAIDRTTTRYDAYYLLHNVPRFNNPSGVFDNDQYLYTIYAPCELGGTNAVSAEAEAALLDIAAAVIALNPQADGIPAFIAATACNT